VRHLALAWSTPVTRNSRLRSGRSIPGHRSAYRGRRRRAASESQQVALRQKKSSRGRLNQRVQDAQQRCSTFVSKDARKTRQTSRRSSAAGSRIVSDRRATISASRDAAREVAAQVDTGAQDSRCSSACSAAATRFSSSATAAGDRRGRAQQLEQGAAAGEISSTPTREHVARLRTLCSGYRGRPEDQRSIARFAGEGTRWRPQQQTAATQNAVEQGKRSSRCCRKIARARRSRDPRSQAIFRFDARVPRRGRRKLPRSTGALARGTARLRLLQQLQERWKLRRGAKAVLQGRLDAALAGAKARRFCRSRGKSRNRQGRRRCSPPAAEAISG